MKHLTLAVCTFFTLIFFNAPWYMYFWGIAFVITQD